MVFVSVFGAFVAKTQKFRPEAAKLGRVELVKVDDRVDPCLNIRHGLGVKVKSPANIPLVMLIITESPRFKACHTLDAIFLASS